MKSVEKGFWIDVGAYLPDVDSVTKAFYERGWRGVNVEPVSDAFTELTSQRPEDINLQIVVGRTPGTVPFYIVPQTGMSTMVREMALSYERDGHQVQETSVRVVTLEEVCRAHVSGDINFLKIDVEGAERDVLSSADFTKYRPWIVLVEATKPNTQDPNHEPWESILLRASYVFVWFDGLNRFYVAEERHDELASSFEIPLNLFDDFVRFQGAAASSKVSRMQAERIVASVYRILLSREPDDAGLANLSEMLMRDGDLTNVLPAMLFGDEFRAKSSALLKR